jgi:hypothetical protein
MARVERLSVVEVAVLEVAPGSRFQSDPASWRRRRVGLRNRESITPSSLAGPEMSAVTVLSWMLILTTPDRGDAPAYHRSQWTTSSKGRRSGRRRGRSRRSAG